MSVANPIVTLITQPFVAINHYIGLNWHIIRETIWNTPICMWKMILSYDFIMCVFCLLLIWVIILNHVKTDSRTVINFSTDTQHRNEQLKHRYELRRLQHEAEQADKQRKHEVEQLRFIVVACLIGLVAILYVYCTNNK